MSKVADIPGDDGVDRGGGDGGNLNVVLEVIARQRRGII